MTEIHIHVHLDPAGQATAVVERPADQQADYEKADWQYKTGWYQGVGEITHATHQISRMAPADLCTYARTALKIVVPEGHADTVARVLCALADHQRNYWGLDRLPHEDDKRDEVVPIDPANAETTIINRIQEHHP